MKRQLIRTFCLIGLFWVITGEPSLRADMQVFPLSTEMQIGKMKTLIDKAPGGLFLTVGGERAFRGGSMFESIEHLVIVDVSPEIMRFNRINVELLKSPNKEVYKYFRWEASWDDWSELSQNLSQEDFDWWTSNVRNIKKYSLPEELNRYGASAYYHKFLNVHQKLMHVYQKRSAKFQKCKKNYLRHTAYDHTSTLLKEDFDWFDKERKNNQSCINTFIDNPSQVVDLGQVIDYKSGNYLFDEKIYQRLHKLVLEGQITIMQADLTTSSDLARVYDYIENLNIQIGVIDFDNLFACEYMGEDKFRIALARLAQLGNHNSILILMHNYKRYACTQFSIYMGFTFENLKVWPQTKFLYDWIHNLPADVYPLLDGKLYERDEELPIYLSQHKQKAKYPNGKW